MKLKRIITVGLNIMMLILVTSVHANNVLLVAPASYPKYDVVRGAESKWDEKNMLILLTDGDGVDFVNIYLDEEVLEISEEYVMGGDNSVFKLLPEYLKTLKPGEHKVRIEYVDGYAVTSITIPGELVEDIITDSSGIISTGPATAGPSFANDELEANITTVGGAYISTTIIGVAIVALVAILGAIAAKKKNGKDE